MSHSSEEIETKSVIYVIGLKTVLRIIKYVNTSI